MGRGLETETSLQLLPDDVVRHMLQSPALSLFDLGRLASASRLFREACLARCNTEDAWLCDLAFSYFEPKLIALLIRWLTLVVTDNLRGPRRA